MGQTYTRQSSFADGDTITAALFNNEYNQLVNAFSYSATNEATTGHRHDGSAGEGGNIPQIGDLDFLNKIVVDSTNNRWGFFVQVSTNTIEQIRLQDGALLPVTDSDVDLGTSSLYFKDAYIDSITTTGNVAVGGNLTVTGTTTFNGGTITMGDAATDNVVFGADVDSNIIPDDDNSYDLGSSTQEWRNLYIDGTANIDSLVADTADINGGTIDGTVIGGSTAAAITGTAITGTSFVIGSATITEAELEILDGATVTTDELNILDGVTASAADINLIDGITNGTVIASKAIITDTNKDITGGRNITITGELDAGSLDISGDADIDGTLEADAITIGGITLAETISDTVGAMVSSNTETNITVSYDDTDNTLDFVIGTLNQDTTGNAATATALETARTIHGVSFDGTANIDLSEVIADTVGAMVSSNTETNITVAYQDDDNTLDFTIGTLNQDTTGNAATATALETARTIGGVSFDGSANINLPGVNTAGNQNTTGNAATATLATTTTVTDSTANTNFPIVFHDESNGLLDDTGALRYNPSTGELLVPKLTVAGTTTQVDTVTMEASNAIIFEGATADAHETTLSVIDPTADRTISLPNATGTLSLITGIETLTNKTLTAPTLTGTAVVASLDISGDIDVDGTTNLDVVDIDGAVDMASTLNVSGAITGTLGTAAQPNITSLGTLTGLTTSGDINFGDNDKAIFGTGNDLEIFHNGTTSYIRDVGDGDLQIFATDDVYIRGYATNNYMARFNENGAVTLYHNDLPKLDTTSTGIDVTGTVSVSDNISNAGAAGSSTVFNESGSTADFRVESTSNTHMLFVDGGTNRVGIGAAPTARTFEVNSGTANTAARFTSTDSRSALEFVDSAGSASIGNLGDHLTFLPAGVQLMELNNEGGLIVTPTAGGHTVFNNGAVDSNFQVKSDGNASMLFVDGGLNKVGIGTSSLDSNSTPLSLGSRTGSALNYINGSTNTISTSTGIFVSHSESGTSNSSMGLQLANNENTADAKSPVIAFSAKSASNNYQHVYATIYGEKVGNGADTNWNTGRLVFGVSDGTGSDDRMILNQVGGLSLYPNDGGHAVFNEGSSDADFRVESNGNTHMLFVDGGNDRVGIGTSSPQEKVHLKSGGTTALRVSGANNDNSKVEIGYDNTNGPYIKAGSSGLTGIQFYRDNTVLSAEIHRNTGDFYTNDGTISSLSDSRVKENIQDLVDGLEVVKQLKPKTFKYNKKATFYDEKTKDIVRYGFIADEVQEVAPQYTQVGKGKIDGVEVDDLKSLSTTKMIPMLIKAIQEQQTQIEALQFEINNLKGE